jgi:23S rRNA (adenine2503-C2)-methyltransferase
MDVKGLTRDQLTAWVHDHGHKPYRAEQLFRWMHDKRVRAFEKMSNVPKNLQSSDTAILGGLTLEKVLNSKDGTRKMILRRSTGERIESVIIPMGADRFTQCVSSQVGCKMACTFCATAQMPVRQNLSSSEIVDQVYHARDVMEADGKSVNNLVYMGMGEPLDNFDNVVQSLKILLDQKGAAFGSRRITVSTVGLAKRIIKFGEEVPVNLAVSLNATTNEQREQIMPVNKAFPIERLMETLRNYPLSPRRRIYVEYVMLGGVNDTDADAARLPLLLQGVRAKINLIPFNPWPGSEFKSPTEERVTYFLDRLMKAGIQTNVRQPKGRDIEAACGMLDGVQAPI